MMKSITRQRIAFAATIMLAFCSITFATPASKYVTIYGRVLKIDKQERIMLVADQWTKKLYLVNRNFQDYLRPEHEDEPAGIQQYKQK